MLLFLNDLRSLLPEYSKYRFVFFEEIFVIDFARYYLFYKHVVTEYEISSKQLFKDRISFSCQTLADLENFRRTKTNSVKVNIACGYFKPNILNKLKNKGFDNDKSMVFLVCIFQETLDLCSLQDINAINFMARTT
jgi:hypothetical protein